MHEDNTAFPRTYVSTSRAAKMERREVDRQQVFQVYDELITCIAPGPEVEHDPAHSDLNCQ
jgi:hypothetical protein